MPAGLSVARGILVLTDIFRKYPKTETSFMTNVQHHSDLMFKGMKMQINRI